jgi:TonB family protein
VGLLRCFSGLLALALGAMPVRAAAAEEPRTMTPSSSWVVDYADDSCALRRAFAQGTDKAILEMRQFAPNNQFQISVISDTLHVNRTVPRVRFEPDETWFEAEGAMLSDAGQFSGFVYWDSLRRHDTEPNGESLPVWTDEDRAAREQSITGLSVRRVFEREFLLQTGAMHAPMEAMRSCLDELLTHWGLDAAAQRTLSRPAMPRNLQEWARRIQERYPSAMLRKMKSGVVAVRLIVRPDGKPASCHVQVRLSDPLFDQSACEGLMRYAEFEPALDAQGAPIASYYTTRIVYMVS